MTPSYWALNCSKQIFEKKLFNTLPIRSLVSFKNAQAVAGGVL